jgi:HD-like signal output (HDOD) protein/ActR/RegA family two-component response regulator
MTRILFVDDEPRLLDGLERMLRPERERWRMAFAGSGARALEMLEAEPFDVVVTDLRMPEMDGARLLDRVRQRFPGAIRVVLYAYGERDAALHSAPHAQQFLAKPCDPAKLRAAIEQSRGCSGMVPDEALRRIVGAVGELPSLPHTCRQLMLALEDPDAAPEEIGRIIERDIGITAKVLQLVNSALFGRSREVHTVRLAVNQLGLDTLRQLILSVELFRTFDPGHRVPGFSLEELEAHSQMVAQIAARLPAPRSTAGNGVMAALLHDSGKLILATRLPKEFAAAIRRSEQACLPLHEVEVEIMGASHAEVGAYLLGLWGLPWPIVEAVQLHHHPQYVDNGGEGLDAVAVTHIANGLAREMSGPPGEILDLDYVARLGIEDQLKGWRTIARQVEQDLAIR